MVEWEKIKKLMNCFPRSIINHNGEFISSIKENEYFILESCKDEREIKCKVLAWFSRGAHKTQHYNSKKKNNEYHQFMIDGINRYLGTNFDFQDMDIIYTELGNDCNRPLCEKFIDSGYDMNILISKLKEQQKFAESMERSRTGYERVDEDESYFVDDTINDGHEVLGGGALVNNLYYNNGNYYNDETIVENNGRADKLFRCLRQWQALHDQPITVEDWREETEEDKFSFFYDYTLERILISYDRSSRYPNVIYFSSPEKAYKAIKQFEGELKWYFTEYMQRLDEV